MPTYIVRAKAQFVLEKVIRAKNMEEAWKIAKQLEPDEFNNFHNFYEWLGSNWREIAENIEVEEF